MARLNLNKTPADPGTSSTSTSTGSAAPTMAHPQADVLAEMMWAADDAAAARRERLVPVQEAPRRVEFAHIPQEILDFFSARGKVATLASGHVEYVPALAAYERFPVEEDEFGAAWETEFKPLLKRHGFYFQGGYIRKGDCVLYAQSAEARDAQISEGFVHFINNRRSVSDQMSELEELLGQHEATARTEVRLYKGSEA